MKNSSSSSKKQHVLQPNHKVKKIGSWIGWGVVYLLAFYLGNLAGEYVAARMPIGSFSLKPKLNIALPRVSFTWNGFNLPTFPKKSAPSIPTTKPVVVAGNVFAVPLSNATQDEKIAFEYMVGSLAVSTGVLTVSGGCELATPFVSQKVGNLVRISNNSTATRLLKFEQQEESVSVPAGQTVSVNMGSKPGVYGIFCDETPAGFSVISE
jgi:hypothetical protein